MREFTDDTRVMTCEFWTIDQTPGARCLRAGETTKQEDMNA